MRGNLDGNSRQIFLQGLFKLRRISEAHAVRAGQQRRAGADHADIQMLARLNFVRNMRESVVATQERLRHIATRFRRRRNCAVDQCNRGENGHQQCHASPPARSASGCLTREEGLRPSITLYHDIRFAVPVMINMPARLIATWTSGPPEYSLMMNCPAKARNTPRQKISRECCPHIMAGRRIGHLRPGQSRGTKRTVTVAKARKCAKRRTSRLVLSIGYIQSLSQLGTKRPRGSTYHVITIANENTR